MLNISETFKTAGHVQMSFNLVLCYCNRTRAAPNTGIAFGSGQVLANFPTF